MILVIAFFIILISIFAIIEHGKITLTEEQKLQELEEMRKEIKKTEDAISELKKQL